MALPERRHCFSQLHRFSQPARRRMARHALYEITCPLLLSVYQLRAFRLRSPSSPFIFFTCFILFFFLLLLLIVKGALEHIPACIGLKEEGGQTAWTGCQSITHAPIHSERHEEARTKERAEHAKHWTRRRPRTRCSFRNENFKRKSSPKMQM